MTDESPGWLARLRADLHARRTKPLTREEAEQQRIKEERAAVRRDHIDRMRRYGKW